MNPTPGLTIRELLRKLDGCMSADAGRLYARLRGLQRRTDTPIDSPILANIANEIEQSQARVRLRALAAPKFSADPSQGVTFPAELPVSQRKDEIAAKVRDFPVVIVAGQTGSGKTTQLPKICLELGRGVRGLIGHTQPRRIAARAVANRVAEELSSRVGSEGLVGFKVRFTDETAPTAMVKVMTDGILLAETRGDPLLSAYDTIIVDEAHERSLNIDFLLGYLKQLLLSGKRPDLKLIITSATIDTERFSRHFALPHVPGMQRGAPIVEVSGRTYPVEVRYRPPLEDQSDSSGSLPTWRRLQTGAMGLSHRPSQGSSASSPQNREVRDEIDMDLPREVLRAVDELATEPFDPTTENARADVLVFLPGEREIRDTEEALRRHHFHGWEIIPLFARLSAEEQQRVFKVQRSTPRRIILATNVAETSLTVPGIRYVIDPGFARISRYSPRQKVQRLPIERISRASAEQRRGRAGRLSPGVCIRLYDQSDFDSRAEFTEPEILRTNLASVILQMMSLFGEAQDHDRHPRGDKADGPSRRPHRPKRRASAATLLKFEGIEAFPFIETPDPRMIRDGYETLVELGAIEPSQSSQPPITPGQPTSRPLTPSERWEAGEEIFEPVGGLDALQSRLTPQLPKLDLRDTPAHEITSASSSSASPSPAPQQPAQQPLTQPPQQQQSAATQPRTSGALYHLTRLGRDLARFPIDPRLGRIILAAHERKCIDEVLVIAAALSIQDPRERPGKDRPELQQAADAAHALFRDTSSDFLGFLRLWSAYQSAAKDLSSSKVRKWCKDHFLNFLRMREWEDIHRQLHSLLVEMRYVSSRRPRVHLDAPSPTNPSDAKHTSASAAETIAERRRAEIERDAHPVSRAAAPNTDPTDQSAPAIQWWGKKQEAIHRALLTGLVTNIGRKSETPPGYEYDGPRAMKFQIFPGSGTFKTGPKWVVASELVRTTRLYAHTVAAVRPQWIEEAAAHLVKRTYHDPQWDPGKGEGNRGGILAFERVTLFGLELTKRRPVDFGPIDPITSRGLFIHHALVSGEYATDADWFQHNRRLIQRVAELESRIRRRGLLVDATRRYTFFDQRLGADVHSGASFERWRRKAEQQNPRILFLGVGDLLDSQSTLPNPEDFPDSLSARTLFGEPLNLKLDYTFAPGEVRDGLTVTIKSSDAERFDPRPLEWLAPGYLVEKIAELIRTLPKAQRAALVPAQRIAEVVAADLPFAKGDLLEELARKLSRLPGSTATSKNAGGTGGTVGGHAGSSSSGGSGAGTTTSLPALSAITITPDMFKPQDLPDHLRVTFRVVSDDPVPSTLAEGRDWSAIRRALSLRVRDTLASLPESRYNRDGITTWDFLSWSPSPTDAAHPIPSDTEFPNEITVDSRHLAGRLIRGVRITPSARPITAYPALVDPDRKPHAPTPKSVSLRLFDHPAAARRAMHRGLRRLLSLQLAEPIRSLVEHTPGIDRLTLPYALLGNKADLRAELNELIAMRAFDDIALAGAGLPGARTTAWSKGEIRTKELFDQALEAGWNHLRQAGDDVFPTVRDILSAHQQLAARLGRTGDPWNGPREWATAISDMRTQLAHLIYPGFLTSTPWKWLKQYPRYLQAISTRLEKLAGVGAHGATPAENLARDTRAAEQILPFWNAWRDADAAKSSPAASTSTTTPPAATQRSGTPLTKSAAPPISPDLGEEPELDEFRWMVEEFRVSIFAQNLQTVVPVSAKRLLAQWEKAKTARERILASTGGEQ